MLYASSPSLPHHYHHTHKSNPTYTKHTHTHTHTTWKIVRSFFDIRSVTHIYIHIYTHKLDHSLTHSAHTLPTYLRTCVCACVHLRFGLLCACTRVYVCACVRCLSIFYVYACLCACLCAYVFSWHSSGPGWVVNVHIVYTTSERHPPIFSHQNHNYLHNLGHSIKNVHRFLQSHKEVSKET